MRCNVGVNPLYLADQHLIAEYRELPMVIGSLEYWNWDIKSDIPDVFNLGPGHMNFLKNKLGYLKRRHEAVKVECRRRGFYCETLSIRLWECKPYLCNDWNPTIEDSAKIRKRVIEKLLHRFELSPKFWKYQRKTMTDIDIQEMIFNLENGELFPV